ncbi:hypothetical protein B4135_2199 [Caldibacillus debilis]|uniref:Uncharacterized protein n=1 Tax=Caldibacillus debilis TaxID=301148 RepID=A0A150M299_9BACI|nr:hypothetical protein B4135_2199 [Caldibacillus debilis]
MKPIAKRIVKSNRAFRSKRREKGPIASIADAGGVADLSRIPSRIFSGFPGSRPVFSQRNRKPPSRRGTDSALPISWTLWSCLFKSPDRLPVLVAISAAHPRIRGRTIRVFRLCRISGKTFGGRAGLRFWASRERIRTQPSETASVFSGGIRRPPSVSAVRTTPKARGPGSLRAPRKDATKRAEGVYARPPSPDR